MTKEIDPAKELQRLDKARGKLLDMMIKVSDKSGIQCAN